MRFKVDENLPNEVALLLREAGYDAATVYDEALVGSPDPVLLDACRAEERIMISLDLGFADIRVHAGATSPGAIVIRAKVQEVEHVMKIMRDLVAILSSESPAGAVWVVDERRVRMRPLGKAPR